MVMQALFSEPPVKWLTAGPFWASARNNRDKMRQPALLRFTTDSFMEDFVEVVTTAPQRLEEWQALNETWRRPAPVPEVSGRVLSLPLEEDPELANKSLKLFQPGNQRFYLVTANLVCRIPGLPDKKLDFSRAEEVGFVLRRLEQQNGTLGEHGLVQGAWQRVPGATGDTLLDGEQQFPLFPVTYEEFDGRRRRLFAGLVPVSAREQYMNAPRTAAVDEPIDESATRADRIAQLLTVLDMDVLQPWQTVNDLWQQEDDKITVSWTEITENAEHVEEEYSKLLPAANLARDKIQTASWYILLDLAEYLSTYLPQVWNNIPVSPGENVSGDTHAAKLINALVNARFEPEENAFAAPTKTQANLRNRIQGIVPTTDGTSLAQALKEVFADGEKLEAATGDYISRDTAETWPWPSGGPHTADVWYFTKFLLCGQGADLRKLIGDEEDNLRDLVTKALDEAGPDASKPVPLLPLAHDITQRLLDEKDENYDNDLFIIRCVYKRPNCPPSVRPTVVSQETEPFRMASYFDPEAPARPIRIPLPVDTTPAGLRKFAKNTMFSVSETLACQIEEVKGLTFGDLVLSVLPWPFHKDLDTGGAAKCEGTGTNIQMLCTLSIPIITLCALILLIIIVFLLDIVFKWVPYLIFCLPLFGNSED